MKKIISLLSVALLFSISIFAQTQADFEKKFGAEKYYKIRPNTFIFPTFDAKGQICRAEVIPNSSPSSMMEDKIHLFQVAYNVNDKKHLIAIAVIDSSELKEIFEELAPVKERQGNPKIIKDFSGFGGYYGAGYRYENVALDVGVLIQKTNIINTQKVAENFDSMINPANGVIYSAVIYWTQRKCSEK